MGPILNAIEMAKQRATREKEEGEDTEEEDQEELVPLIKRKRNRGVEEEGNQEQTKKACTNPPESPLAHQVQASPAPRPHPQSQQRPQPGGAGAGAGAVTQTQHPNPAGPSRLYSEKATKEYPYPMYVPGYNVVFVDLDKPACAHFVLRQMELAIQGRIVEPLPICQKHQQAVRELTVQQAGLNHGRKFFKCARNDTSCLDFRWRDDWEDEGMPYVCMLGGSGYGRLHTKGEVRTGDPCVCCRRKGHKGAKCPLYGVLRGAYREGGPGLDMQHGFSNFDPSFFAALGYEYYWGGDDYCGWERPFFD